LLRLRQCIGGEKENDDEKRGGNTLVGMIKRDWLCGSRKLEGGVLGFVALLLEFSEFGFGFPAFWFPNS
jgi:hypothetical protein